MTGKKFTCEGCGGTFLDPTTEETKMKEFREHFPNCPHEDRASLCEDCYKVFMEWFRDNPPVPSN